MLKGYKTIGGVLTAAALFVSGSALAAPQDYRFEQIGEPAYAGDVTILTVRLVHLPDGKPVTNATSVRGHVEMEAHAKKIEAMVFIPTVEPGTEPGTYKIEAGLSMKAKWYVHLGATVPGEAEEVRGEVVYSGH